MCPVDENLSLGASAKRSASRSSRDGKRGRGPGPTAAARAKGAGADGKKAPRKRMTYAQRNSQLLDIAEGLFINHGFAAISMEDFARAAGVSRPLVYQHLRTKEDAYLACVRRARQSYEAMLLDSVAGVTSPREQLRAGAEAFFKLLEEHQGRWLLLFGSNAVLPGEFNTELANLRFSTIEQIHVLIRAATPGGPPARIEAAAHAASGVGERLGHWWIARPEITREDLVEHFVELVWNGVSPYVPPGEPSSPQP